MSKIKDYFIDFETARRWKEAERKDRMVLIVCIAAAIILPFLAWYEPSVCDMWCRSFP